MNSEYAERNLHFQQCLTALSIMKKCHGVLYSGLERTNDNFNFLTIRHKYIPTAQNYQKIQKNCPILLILDQNTVNFVRNPYFVS
jgi:hypothetical protein